MKLENFAEGQTVVNKALVVDNCSVQYPVGTRFNVLEVDLTTDLRGPLLVVEGKDPYVDNERNQRWFYWDDNMFGIPAASTGKWEVV